jgi:hypothetical protein
MSRRIVRSLLVSAVVLPVFGVHAAEPWVQAQVLTPPTEAGYTALSLINFGRDVAMWEGWLAVTAPSGACAGPAGQLLGTVLMYRYDAATQGFVYSQQVCSGYTDVVRLGNGWMVAGNRYRDATTGDGAYHGRVSFFKLNEATQQWSLTQTADGGTDRGFLGSSVAIAGGVVAAGEPGYDENRGRVHTWRLNALGTAWISEGTIGPSVSPLTPRVSPDEGFGNNLALDVRGCRAPSCSKPHDTMIVPSRSGLHSIERLASGWGSRALLKPARGTTTPLGPVAINGAIAVGGTSVSSDNPGDSPCPPNGAETYSTMARVLARSNGSAHLAPKGFACMDRLGLAPLRSSIAFAVSPQGNEFVVGTPDLPSTYLGVVSTWDLSGAGGAIQPTDFVVDLDYTQAYYEASSHSLRYQPNITGDYFGSSVALLDDRLAVGAPFFNGFTGYAAGYVVIYSR